MECKGRNLGTGGVQIDLLGAKLTCGVQLTNCLKHKSCTLIIKHSSQSAFKVVGCLAVDLPFSPETLG